MTVAPSPARRLRIIGIAVMGSLLAIILAALLLLSFGWGLLRPLAERRASAALGRQVSITRIRRMGGGLFHPMLAVEGVRIAQPGWAGSGDMVRLRAARVRIAALPLLVGRLDPQVTMVDGLRVSLLRTPSGRANWTRQDGADRGGASPDFGQITVRDAVIALDDRQNRQHFTANLSVDAGGVRIGGSGVVGDTPATIMVLGPAVHGDAPWPFRAEIVSAAVRLSARGQMRTPLDLGHFSAEVESSGRSLLDLDHLIAAGLPPTQPYRLRARVQHDGPAWIITGLVGRLGRSDLSGDVTVRKRGSRSYVDASLRSNGFDFDDLATDEQLARAAAEARRIGPRLVPATRIRLDKLRQTDGRMQIDFRHLLSRTPSVFRSLAGVLTLDHGILTGEPMRAGLVAGSIFGTFVIRHQSGEPTLLLDARLRDGRVERLVRTGGIVSGAMAGRVRLTGRGSTVREAIGRANGRVGVVVPDGTITRRVALFLGADVGRGLFAGKSDRTAIRCIIGNFAVAGGTARPAPLVFDTPVARADGTGHVDLASEAVALDLHGTPKKGDALRLNGPIMARGTLENPTFNPPPEARTVGSILKMVGKALGGRPQPLATDADCRGLAAAALR